MKAASGVDAMFLMGNSTEAGTEEETRQGMIAAEAAKAAGVGHLVYSSVADANEKTGIPRFDSKALVERHIAAAVAHLIRVFMEKVPVIVNEMMI